jgi:hypothetical protein
MEAKNLLPLVPQPNEKPRERIERLAELIRRTLPRDSGMHHATPYRVARGVVKGGIPEEELIKVLDDVFENIQAVDPQTGEPVVKCPGAYGTTSCKNLLAHWGVPWSETR